MRKWLLFDHLSQRFEEEFYDYLNLTYPGEMNRLATVGSFKDEENVRQIILDFIESFDVSVLRS